LRRLGCVLLTGFGTKYETSLPPSRGCRWAIPVPALTVVSQFHNKMITTTRGAARAFTVKTSPEVLFLLACSGNKKPDQYRKKSTRAFKTLRKYSFSYIAPAKRSRSSIGKKSTYGRPTDHSSISRQHRTAYSTILPYILYRVGVGPRPKGIKNSRILSTRKSQRSFGVDT
jgi:hypothetical protein